MFSFSGLHSAMQLRAMAQAGEQKPGQGNGVSPGTARGSSCSRSPRARAQGLYIFTALPSSWGSVPRVPLGVAATRSSLGARPKTPPRPVAAPTGQLCFSATDAYQCATLTPEWLKHISGGEGGRPGQQRDKCIAPKGWSASDAMRDESGDDEEVPVVKFGKCIF